MKSKYINFFMSLLQKHHDHVVVPIVVLVEMVLDLTIMTITNIYIYYSLHFFELHNNNTC